MMGETYGRLRKWVGRRRGAACTEKERRKEGRDERKGVGVVCV